MVRISPPGPGGPSVKDGDVSEGADANAPRDVIVVLAGCPEIATETLDKLCMWRVNPRSGSRKCYELSHSILCDEGGITFALCPPG